MELRRKTTAHLEQLMHESAETFGRYIALPELGKEIYLRLAEHFNLDGAQEIAGCLVDLFSGVLDSGTVMVSKREYRGMSLVLDEFGEALPDGPRTTLADLVTTLRKAGP
jgi:hypothetical protein